MLIHPAKTPQRWQRAELVALQSVDEQMRAALAYTKRDTKRARAYLNERGISLEVAQMAGVCYTFRQRYSRERNYKRNEKP